MAYRTPETLKEETRLAKECNILYIAEHFGYSLKQKYDVFIAKSNKELTFFPSTNSFYDYYNSKGGTTIDFVMNELGCSVGEAIKYINEEISHIYTEDISSTNYTPVNVSSNKELQMPKRNDTNNRVFAYLNKSRGIDKNIISEMMHKHLLYEESGKHNAVFVGVDKDGNAKHCFIRGTLTGIQYRGDSKGSDKAYGFSRVKNLDQLIVFEAPIDLLSYMTLYSNDDSSLLALGMLSMEPIYQFCKDYGTKQISFMLDHDDAGIEATKRFTKELQEKGFTVVKNNLNELLESNQCKDVNELLMKIKKENEVQIHAKLNK